LTGFDFDGGGFTKYFVPKISGPSGFESGKDSCSDNMRWLQRLFSPRMWSFVIFALVLAAILAGACFYSGIIKRRDVARVMATVRHTFIGEVRLRELKMERTTLEFQLANLPNKFPILTNAAAAREWSAAAILSQLDPDVRQTWNDYLGRVSPLVVRADHNLEIFLAIRSAYEQDVDELAGDRHVTNKIAGLLNLRTNKYASLFTNSVYLDDHARFERAAVKIVDDETIALREAYWAALVSAVTNLDPRLSDYSSAVLAVEIKSGAIGRRLNELTQQLGGLGELPEPAEERIEKPAPVQRPEPPPGDRKFFETYVPEQRDFVIAGAATLIIGFLMTLPAELRPRRWLKIGASLALVFAGLLTLRVQVSIELAQRHESLFTFLVYLVPAILLTGIWAPVLASLVSKFFLHLLDWPQGETPISNFRSASLTARRGDFNDALRFVKRDPTSDHEHYETFLLKAKLHRQMNHKWRTWLTLKKVLRNPNLTEGQRHHASNMLRHLGDRTHACWKI
jgi:hypothetical protein